jgi:secondary thiamine-phosphate synthase enzyme
MEGNRTGKGDTSAADGLFFPGISFYIAASVMLIEQYRFALKPRSRGFHLVTEEIVSRLEALGRISAGVCHLFILHSSASLAVNENADPTVRVDFESHMRRVAPDAAAYYRHDYEGDDDMSAHIKAGIFGPGLTIPVSKGSLVLGTWQGIYLGEHRERGGAREIMATLMGEERAGR